MSDSPAVARRTSMRSLELREVVGVQRLAELEHHVVRDVDDRVNRRALRRGAGARAARAASRGVARRPRSTRPAKRGQRAPAFERDRERVARAWLRRPGGALRERVLRRAASSRAMPSTLKQSPRFGVTLTSRIGVVEVQILGERACPSGASASSISSPSTSSSELELLGRAQHAVRLHAAKLRGADRLAARQRGADARERRLHAGGDVRRAADDLVRPRRRRRPRRPTAVGVRMRLRASTSQPRRCRARAGQRLDRLDLEPGVVRSAATRCGVAVELDPVP